MSNPLSLFDFQDIWKHLHLGCMELFKRVSTHMSVEEKIDSAKSIQDEEFSLIIKDLEEIHQRFVDKVVANNSLPFSFDKVIANNSLPSSFLNEKGCLEKLLNMAKDFKSGKISTAEFQAFKDSKPAGGISDDGDVVGLYLDVILGILTDYDLLLKQIES